VVTVLVFYLYGCFNEQCASALHTFAQLFERLALPFTTEKGTYLGSTFHTCSIFNGRRASNSGSRTSYEDGVKASSSSAEHLEKSRKIDVNWELEKCGIFTTTTEFNSLLYCLKDNAFIESSIAAASWMSREHPAQVILSNIHVQNKRTPPQSRLFFPFVESWHSVKVRAALGLLFL